MERRADTDSDMEDVPVDAFLQSARDDDTECLEQSLGMRGFVRLDDVLADRPARHETQDFTETIGFGSPSLIYGLNSNFVADSFSVRQPDFSDLDAFRGGAAEAEPLPVEELEADDAELAEPADSDSPAVPQEAAVGGGQDDDRADGVPVLESLGAAFSFSVFGRDCLPVTELLPVDAEDAAPEPVGAIVANADGTFCIADRLPFVPDGAAALDTQFKALIDSVL
ncbi:MAG: hypothetical protein HDR38_06090 [Treponema sp.]|nr:hypothetical protein [Treponema sp.]